MKQNNLNKIVESIESSSEYYKKSHFPEVRNAYDEYVRIIILDAEKDEQYNLCNYWDRLKNI